MSIYNPMMMTKYNPEQAAKTWKPIISKYLGVNENSQDPNTRDKMEWLVEYAHNHHMYAKIEEQKARMNMQALNENIPYVNMGNITGMGPVTSPISTGIPGLPTTGFQTGINGVGSGDIGHNLLPVALKIAAQTIGMDLVAVKPSPGPVFDLFYLDFRYDDNPNGTNEKPQLFKVDNHANLRAYLNNVRNYARTQDEKNPFVKVIFHAPTGVNTWPDTTTHTTAAPAPVGGNRWGATFTTELVQDPSNPNSPAGGQISNIPANAPAGMAGNTVYTHFQFHGYSRNDGKPMFRAFRQDNNNAAQRWAYRPSANSLSPNISIAELLGASVETDAAGDMVVANSWSAFLPDGNGAPIAPNAVNPYTPTVGNEFPLNITPFLETLPITNTNNPSTEIYLASTGPVSTQEDHVPGFSTNWNDVKPMNRGEDEDFYYGDIGADMTSKRIEVGGTGVSAAVKRNTLEDTKSQFGIDIVEKLQAILVNEISQIISKEIVDEIYILGNINRQSVPGAKSASNPALYPPAAGAPSLSCPFIEDDIITPFDYYVESYTIAPGAGNPGTFENHEALQRKLISKLINASSYILVEGRVGPATFAVTNHNLASLLFDISTYDRKPFPTNMTNFYQQLYPLGTVHNMTVYVNPYQETDDNRIVIGRKNTPELPGLVFIPYLMAQQISLISEATTAPRLFLRSRYALTRIGFFPEKQYMTIYVCDPQNRLM